MANGVVARAGEDRVVAPRHVDRVVAFVAKYKIGIGGEKLLEYRVVAGTRNQGVGALPAIQGVVAAVAEGDVGALPGPDAVGAVGRIGAADDRLPRRGERHVDRVEPGLQEQQHGAAVAAGEDAVIFGAAIDGAGIANLQHHGVVAAVARDGGRSRPLQDAVVAGEPDDGAGTVIARLVQRVISGCAGGAVSHQ